MIGTLRMLWDRRGGSTPAMLHKPHINVLPAGRDPGAVPSVQIVAQEAGVDSPRFLDLRMTRGAAGNLGAQLVTASGAQVLALDSADALAGVHEALQQYLDNQDDCAAPFCINGLLAGEQGPCPACAGSGKKLTPRAAAVQVLVDQLDAIMAKLAEVPR